MSFARPSLNGAIPTEYRPIVEGLFRTFFEPAEKSAFARTTAAFAKALGVGEDFAAVIAVEKLDENPAARRILNHFRNNVELLIQKTWIEKADELHKEKLLDRIPVFHEYMENGDIKAATKIFVHIVDELAYLLFGVQSRKGDFIEYAFRIDDQLGLFWWYAGNLSSIISERADADVRALLFIGVCFLAAI